MPQEGTFKSAYLKQPSPPAINLPKINDELMKTDLSPFGENIPTMRTSLVMNVITARP